MTRGEERSRRSSRSPEVRRPRRAGAVVRTPGLGLGFALLLVALCAPSLVAQSTESPSPDTSIAPPPSTPGGEEAPAAPSPTPGTTPPAPTLTFHGFLGTRYRIRWTGDESDQDLDQYIRVEGGDARGLGVTGALYLRVHGDLDSAGDSQGYTVFEDLWDTWEGRIRTRFYYGYLDFHHVPGVSLARLGRQLIVETPERFHFDGGRVES